MRSKRGSKIRNHVHATGDSCRKTNTVICSKDIIIHGLGKMVAMKSGRFTTVPLETVLSGKKTVNIDAYYDKKAYRVKVKTFLNAPMFLE